MKQTLLDLKENIDYTSIMMVGDFDISLSQDAEYPGNIWIVSNNRANESDKHSHILFNSIKIHVLINILNTFQHCLTYYTINQVSINF